MLLKALVVEDDRQTRHSMKTVLEENGYAVTTASNGKVALLLLKWDEPHVVITDILMPEMDGLELIRSIRKEFGLKVPILALSDGDAHVRDVYLKCARLLGADITLSKPVGFDQLLGSVGSLLFAR